MFALSQMISGLEKFLVFQNVFNSAFDTIDSVLLYEENEPLLPNCFYVCSALNPPTEAVALPENSYLVFSEAQPRGGGEKERYPGNSLGFSLSTAAVLNCLSLNHSHFVRFMERLRETDDLQTITEYTGRAVNCPVSIVNSFCEKISYSVSDRPKSEIFRQLSERGKLSFNIAQELLVSEKNNTSNDILSFESGEAFVTDYVIRYNEKAITRILIECDSREDERRCAPYMDEMFRRVRPMILANDIVGSVEKDQINMLLSDIIDRNLTDAEEIEQKVALALNSFKGKYYQPVVVKFKKREEKIPMNYISGQLTNIFPASVATAYNRGLVVLCAKKNLSDPLGFNERSLADLLEEFDAYAGIGECTHSMTSLRILYIQAAAATRLGRTFCRDQACRIFSYRDYSPYFLVDLCIDDLIKRHKFGNVSYLCDPGIICLLRYDKKYKTNLEETLRCYISCSCNARQCADTMGVHRNTVINRVRIIEEQIGGSLSHADMYFKVMISLKVIDYQREYMEQDPLDMGGRSIDDQYWDVFMSAAEKQ